ncbi:hypothetical protein [Aquicella siphonis]|uniref:hypothetical protein n=1 Tax=Aquicella siphonis TaxID=254247 RepID=UPI0011DCEF11|nr:hypothetical protein [Aquicella siphonis]
MYVLLAAAVAANLPVYKHAGMNRKIMPWFTHLVIPACLVIPAQKRESSPPRGTVVKTRLCAKQ